MKITKRSLAVIEREKVYGFNWPNQWHVRLYSVTGGYRGELKRHKTFATKKQAIEYCKRGKDWTVYDRTLEIK